jgi:hypothetical protein
MIQRNVIIETLKERLFPLTYVHALWLEGADANGMVDEYSDIDICMDIDDPFETEAIEEVEQILNDIAPVDYRYVMHHGHPKLRQRIYHISGTSPYLSIDFSWQLHSRDPKESCFIRESRIEFPLVLFDKTGVISYKDLDINEFHTDNANRYKECLYRYTQHDRVMKYVYRGHYLEAYAYYNRYVLEPLIDLLRILYTPAFANYYLIHISNHLPEEYVRKLEYFARLSTIEDITERVGEAKEWFDSLGKEVKREYGDNFGGA